jgi:phosphatidylserine synthase 2
VRRTVQQFTPHSWTKFEWGANKSFKKFSMMLGLSAIVSYLMSYLYDVYLSPLIIMLH